MENVLWLDRLKLRGSYAVTGSVNFDAYQALATYEYYTDDRYRYWFGSHLQGLAMRTWNGRRPTNGTSDWKSEHSITA